MRTLGTVTSSVLSNPAYLFDNFSKGDIFLDPFVGQATTPDNAAYTIGSAAADDFTITAKVHKLTEWTGTDQVICAQGNSSPQLSWMFHLNSSGNLAFSWGSSGTSYAQTGSMVLASSVWQTGRNFWVGMTFRRPLSGPIVLQAMTSTNGVTWTNTGTAVNLATSQAFLNSTDPISIGGRGSSFRWDGRIYECEFRTGLIPGAGTLLWRFDSAEWVSGTTWTDARTLPWTVSSAAAMVKSLDSTKWDVYDRVADLANSEILCNCSRNVTIVDGMFNLMARNQTYTCRDYIAGDLTPRTFSYTAGQMAQVLPPFLYGTITCRAKVSAAQGTWPCIWLLGYLWQESQPWTANISGHGWPGGGWCEIDMAEFWPQDRNGCNNGVFWNAVPNDNTIAALPFNAETRFMTYRLIWSAASMVWQVDGEDGVGFRTTKTRIGNGTNIPNVPMYFLIDVAVGGSAGAPNAGEYPSLMEVDYVRITQP